MARCIANTRIVKAFHTECFITIISVTLFPSNKFPRLLAEREIIANALFFTNDVMCNVVVCHAFLELMTNNTLP